MQTKLFLSLFLCILQAYSLVYSSNIRKAAVAGQFYPAKKNELNENIKKFFKPVPPQKSADSPIAVIVPHAGYMFSGQTAAYAYKFISNKKIDTAVIIGNSHKFPLNQGAIYSEGGFETPLGIVEINKKLCDKILSNSNMVVKNILPHETEHSIEVQLPFLQYTFGNIKIVPILLSTFSLNECKQIGEAVAKSIQEMNLTNNVIIIASSDMSHYPSWASANMCDSKALKTLEKFDPPALKKTITEIMASNVPDLACVFCSEESVYTAMYAAKALGAGRIRILKYNNSGDITGEKKRVVGYSAAAFLAPAGTKKINNKILEDKMTGFNITEKNRAELLKIARESIQQQLKTHKAYLYKTTDTELNKPAAVFVTLTINGNLRGCIGTTEPRAPLCQAVSRLAIAAAVEDFRFEPLTIDELKKTHIEISVLSPLERIKNADSIKENIHGVVVRREGRSGLFLPQVWEHFKSKEDFMNELCTQKAGIEPDAWKKADTELYIFTVFSFEEKK